MLVEMSPQKAIHAEVISRLSERLVRALNGRARVRAQAPLALSDDSEPEPDVAVVPSGDYFGDHPSTALLVVEVADSSLRKDRRIKGSLYAEALIAEYWIVNLQDREIELLTQPESGSYTKEDRKRIDDVIRLVGFPDIEIPVDTILPRR
jgi:Uma2 family endonuclease